MFEIFRSTKGAPVSDSLQLATKTQRSLARLIGFALDNPLVGLICLSGGLSQIKQAPMNGFFMTVFGLAQLVGYFYLARKGTSPAKAIFGLQVVNSETGKHIGIVRMILRDNVVMMMSWTYMAYFALLIMSIFQPSTARNRYEEGIENAQRTASAALAVGSAGLILKTGALFKHDNWFSTTVVKKTHAQLKSEFVPQAPAKPKETLSRAA